MPVKFCLRRGCNELVSDGSYCARHRTTYRSPSSSRDAGPRWRRMRRAQKRRARVCERCGAPPPLFAHHRSGAASAAARGYERWDEIDILCGRCHKAADAELLARSKARP